MNIDIHLRESIDCNIYYTTLERSSNVILFGGFRVVHRIEGKTDKGMKHHNSC